MLVIIEELEVEILEKNKSSWDITTLDLAQIAT